MARGRKFSRIIQAARLYPAVDNWVKYMTDATKRGSRVGQGTPRPESQILYIEPFDLKLAATQKVKVSAALPSWTTYKGNFTEYTTDTAPTPAGNIIKPANFSPARIMILEGRSSDGKVATSARTGMKYLKYGGKSTSIPFGKKADTDTELGNFNAISNAIRASFSQRSLKITRKAEKNT